VVIALHGGRQTAARHHVQRQAMKDAAPILLEVPGIV